MRLMYAASVSTSARSTTTAMSMGLMRGHLQKRSVPHHRDFSLSQGWEDYLAQSVPGAVSTAPAANTRAAPSVRHRPRDRNQQDAATHAASAPSLQRPASVLAPLPGAALSPR